MHIIETGYLNKTAQRHYGCMKLLLTFYHSDFSVSLFTELVSKVAVGTGWVPSHSLHLFVYLSVGNEHVLREKQLSW